MPDLETRVEELEATVVWLADALCNGKVKQGVPKILQPTFAKKNRPDEAGRQEGLKIGFTEGSGLVHASEAERAFIGVEG